MGGGGLCTPGAERLVWCTPAHLVPSARPTAACHPCPWLQCVNGSVCGATKYCSNGACVNCSGIRNAHCKECESATKCTSCLSGWKDPAKMCNTKA